MDESVLLVDGDETLRRSLGDRLRSEGYVVDIAADGYEAFELASTQPFDLIVMDVVLARRSGFDVCRDLRSAGMAVPILLLTARADTVDKVVGLKLGADDYVTKPFDMPELLARVEVLLRRVPVRSGNGAFEFGSIRVDLKQAQVTRNSKPVYLTAREFHLLRYLIERSGSTVPRDELLKSVWGYNADMFTRTVDTHVFSLRKKLEETPKLPELILTVMGVGYKFVGRENR